MAEKNGKKITPFQQEIVDTVKKVREYKTATEASVVSILYKKPDELYNVNLNLDDFSENVWKVYFEIARAVIVEEKKNTLDDIVIGLYLEKHPKLKAKYDEYGGYSTMEAAMEYVKTENLDSYISELKKWRAVIDLCKRGFPVKDRLSDYADMTAEEIYNELEVYLNHTFVDVCDDVVSYDITDGIDELIEELDKGTAIGLPYYNLPMLTKETGGQYMGSITLVGGLSNVGKSSFCRTSTIMSIISSGEKIVVMLNEDGLKKWQREILVFVCNNILKFDLQKHIVRDGKYSPEVKAKLFEASQWIKEKTEDHTITVIPFQQYQTSKAIKVIRKYAHMGIKYYMLDTFKMDAGKVSENSWLQLQQAMVDINDVIKPEALDLHILISFQLNKGSVKQRYYTQDNIGLAKNIIDPVSTCIMIRDLLPDEFEGNREVKVYRLEGTKTKIPEKLDKDKHYQVLFIVKNREGAANQYQIVVEHDLSRNVIREVGICNILPDSF